ncbi:BglG family transcription antiterminator LicT [Caldalkalibacillus salinus]|uniref:BglG family transcription antiterminator LicT n=1 Tax=Caldalkalibacillus salinus TaxID=2803787 RepID=UPI001921F16D|nr:PRD domain-containing protein [Caldalkalibacillus salinus]
MNIKKIFNNNVVLLEDDNQQEMVVMGKGIGFNKNKGEEIDFSKVDKKFVLSKSMSDKLVDLIRDISPEHLHLSNLIIEQAKKELDVPLNDNIYITLTDHISFALSRIKEGLVIKNALYWEVKKFYTKEYEVALKAKDIIEKEMAIVLPEDEAASIALHLVNAQQGEQDMEQTVTMTQIVTDVRSIVKYHYGMDMDENSINYSRFMTHLRYFAYRILRDDWVTEEDDFLYHQVKAKYPEAYRCVQKIVTYLETHFGKVPTKEEQVYFMIHIHRVTSREKKHTT